MFRTLEILKACLRTGNGQKTDAGTQASADENVLAKTLERTFSGVRAVDPATDRQWLSLRRSLVEPDQKRETRSLPARPRLAFGLALGAAAIVAAILIGQGYFKTNDASPATYSTSKGEQKEITLADSSHVTLSYLSGLIVTTVRPGEPRRVTVSGEAYFHVRHNGSPFIVATSHAEVEVVGTEFNIRARGDALEVAVIDGVVRVRARRNGRDSSLVLMRHQMALCPNNGFPMRLGDIISSEYPGWLHGKLFLSGTSLPAACNEIGERFDVDVRAPEQGGRTGPVTGILDARTPESAIAALCELTGKRFTHDGRTYQIF